MIQKPLTDHQRAFPILRRLLKHAIFHFHTDRTIEPGIGQGTEELAPVDIAHARQLALRHDDLTSAATLLLQLGDPAAAEARLLTEPGRIDGNDYGRLVPLAKALRNHDCPRGETVIYRALLKGILDRAYARAYGHAARYWSRLQEIANGATGLLPLPSHDEFEAEIRARHGRKTAFWAHVNGTRRDRHDVDDDE